MKYSKTVDSYLEANESRQKELQLLRKLALSTGLKESVKWGAPVYVYDGKNIVGLGAFKSYVGLWFFNGALLEDHARVLMNAQKGVTKAMRQWRFNSLQEIEANETEIVKYINEAIENQKHGREIKPARGKPLTIPALLQNALREKPAVNKAFQSLSKSKRREYADYISSARHKATKEKRLEKIIPMIEEGMGLNDKYR